MRRPGTVRAASAQSLCIFCACRLAIDFPAASNFTPTPFGRSVVFRRRQIGTIRSTQWLSAKDAESSAAPAQQPSPNLSTSTLTESEQREKAARIAARQQHDDASQPPSIIRKPTFATRQPSLPSSSGSKARTTWHKEQDKARRKHTAAERIGGGARRIHTSEESGELKLQPGSLDSGNGIGIAAAMGEPVASSVRAPGAKQAGKVTGDRENDGTVSKVNTPRINKLRVERGTDSPRIRHVTVDTSVEYSKEGEREFAMRGPQNANAPNKNSKQTSNVRTPKKVPNPFAGQSSATQVEAPSVATAGWGAAGWGAAREDVDSLENRQVVLPSHDSTRAAETKENPIDVVRSGNTKTFRLGRRPSQPSEDFVTEQDLKKQQQAYDRAGEYLDDPIPSAESQEHMSQVKDELMTREVAAEDEVTTDPSVDAQPPPPSNEQDPVLAVNTGSFGYFGEEEEILQAPAGEKQLRQRDASDGANRSAERATERSRSSDTQEPERSEASGVHMSEQGGVPRKRSGRSSNNTQTTSRDAYSESGYKSTMFKPGEFRAKPSSIAEDNSDGWQHLRKRNTETAQAAPSPPPPQLEAKQSSKERNSFLDDDAWVDGLFQNHLHQRRPQQQQHPRQDAGTPAARNSNDRYSRPIFTEENVKNKICARCGEKGHIARNCNGPILKDHQTQRLRQRSFRPSFGVDFSDNAGPNREHDDRGSRNLFRKPGREYFDDGSARQGGVKIRGVNPTSPFDVEPPQLNRHISNPFEDAGSAQTSYRPPDTVSATSMDPQNDIRQGRLGRSDPSTRPQGHVSSDVTFPDGRVVRRSQWAEEDEANERIDERKSKEKDLRRGRWAEDDVENNRPSSGRRTEGRSGRREFDEDEDEEEGAREAFRARKAARQAAKDRERKHERMVARQEREVRKAENPVPTSITLPEFISVQNLSQMLGVRYEQFVDRLEELGYDDVFPGKTLNSEVSGMIAMEYNYEPKFDGGAQEQEERDLKPRPEVQDREFLPVRPPVVTIMGHVDHGKTTILDYLRKSSVAAGEAGGITQHIGAFSVPLASTGKTITFLDTPGHEAFLTMRQRGANVTDIVILVVAADDSVKPQTLEAIKHAKAASVPMVVAINKIDKPEANAQQVKQDLARHGVEIEDYGGETQVVEVSGKTGRGMGDLEETVVTLSEILDHRAETDGPVEGWVLEATTKERGRVATVLVRRGTLKTGSIIVAGRSWARVRTLRTEGGKVLDEVGPGMPIEVDGWKDQPMAGDEVLQAPSEQKANSVVEFRIERDERERTAQDTEAINESRRLAQEKHAREKAAQQAAKQAQRQANVEGGTADVPTSEDSHQEQKSGQMAVPFIIKADVSGSAEAVSAYIMGVSNPLIAPQILTSSIGAVNESDIEYADAAGGHIIAFNLPANPEMKGAAEARGVQILENNVIYRVLDDVKAVLEEKLPPIISQRVLGEAEVGAAFDIRLGGRKTMKIAGCKIRNGVIGKNARVRVTRGGEKLYDGLITSLKNVKRDVTEMRKGTECGMGFEGWEGFEVGDQVQTYEEISEKRKL